MQVFLLLIQQVDYKIESFIPVSALYIGIVSQEMMDMESISSLLKKGEVLIDSGKLNEVEVQLERLYELVKDESVSDNRAQTCYLFGKLYTRMGAQHYNKTEEYLNEAMEILGEADWKSGTEFTIKAKVYNQSGLLYYQQNRLDEALKILETSRSNMDSDQVTLNCTPLSRQKNGGFEVEKTSQKQALFIVNLFALSPFFFLSCLS